MSMWFSQRPSIFPLHLMLNRRPKAAPPALWRRLIWLRVWAVLHIVVQVGFFTFLVSVGGYGMGLKVGFLALAVMLGVIVNFAPLLVGRRPRREVLAANYRLCFHCGYSLEHLPDEHRCPECGAEYTFAQIREGWLDWYANRPGHQPAKREGAK